MARSRNIKPAFFDNEDLAELSYEYRLLFIGLWCLADREGRLENRPKKIKAKLFAYDSCNVEEGLRLLAGKKLISIYEINENSYIQVVTFLDHQKPHGTEKDSLIPCINGYLTVNERASNGLIKGEPKLVNVKKDNNINGINKITVNNELNNSYLTLGSTSDNALIPDSLTLIPDSKKPSVPVEENVIKRDTGEIENYHSNSYRGYEPEKDGNDSLGAVGVSL